jgi:DNA repair protein RadA
LEEDNDFARDLALDTIEEIGPSTKSRLEEAGFKSIKDLVVRGPVDIAETTGI